MKKLGLLSVIIVLILFGMGCSRPSYVEVPDEKLQSIKQAQDIFDVLKETETIELELDYGLSPFHDFIIGEKYVVGIIASSQFRTYLWKKDGTFLGEIASYGKGPGEYMSGVTGCFVDSAHFLLFDRYLLRCSLFKLDEDQVIFLDTYDTTKWVEYSIDLVFFHKGEIFCFNFAGNKGVPRMLVLDRNITTGSGFFTRKHVSHIMFETFNIFEDRIFMTEELYHKNLKKIRTDPLHPENTGKILITDLKGNLVHKVKFNTDTVAHMIIPDKEMETLFLGDKIIDLNGNNLKIFDDEISIGKNGDWMKTSQKVRNTRDRVIYAKKVGDDEKIVLHLFEYRI